MSKINTIIQKMKNDAEYKKYFFRNAPKYQKLHLWLKPLYDEGYFDPKNIPKPVEDKRNKGYFSIPPWEVLDFLEAVAVQNRDDFNEEVARLLLKIVDKIISFQSGENRIENFRVDWYAVKILFILPHEMITLEHIDFIGISLRKTKYGGLLHSDLGTIVLPVLIENRKKDHLLRLLPILFEYNSKEDSLAIKERVPLVKKYWLYEITKKYPKIIASIVGIDGVIILVGIMKKILESDNGAFNIVWITTIENSKQNSFPDRYDNQIVSFVRDMLEEISPDKSMNLIESLLADNHIIFKRLAIHILNYHYNLLRNLFWKWFESEDNTLGKVYKHELYQLLLDRASLFSEEEIERVVKWIESLDYRSYYQDRTAEEVEVITAYRRKEWLMPLRYHSIKAQELYDKYTKLAPEEIEHPGYDYWSSGFRRLDNSPLNDKDVFCSKSVDEIIDKIKNFDHENVDKDSLIESEDWIEGLASDLGNCIKKNPKKFVAELKKFDGIDLVYYYYIFDGLERAWKNKENFDWKNIFAILEHLLDDTLVSSNEKYAIWVKGKIPELLRVGMERDDHAFDKEYLPQAKKILLKLLNHPEEDDVDINNLLSFSLNSSNGKVLHGLMGYALRYGRLHSDKDVKWEPEIKSFFTKQLELNNNYSLYVFNILGEYLPQIRFLDRKWADQNMNKIFPLEKHTLWQASFMSYMSSTTMVYQKDYEYFKSKGHFKKALNSDWPDDHVRQKVLQFIVIAYMNEFDNEALFRIIREKNIENNLEIIRFIWHLYRENPDEKRAFINELWNVIYNLYKDDESGDMQRVFSTLSKWFVFIENINDTNIDWLKKSAQWTEINFNSYLILEQLLRLVEDHPKRVAEIYLAMIENGFYPTYKEEDIIVIIEKLFELGEITQARVICNKYASNGIYFLNELNKKYSNM